MTSLARGDLPWQMEQVTTSVQLSRPADDLRALGIDHVDVIKIDVEGRVGSFASYLYNMRAQPRQLILGCAGGGSSDPGVECGGQIVMGVPFK